MKVRALGAIAILVSIVSNAAAVMIDDFSEGSVSRGPNTTDIALQQGGLPTSSVIGGARDWFAQYGGSLSVGPPSGSLALNHDRGPFEVAILRYGQALNGSPLAPLNADLTDGGHSQITFHIERTARGIAGEGSLPAFLRLSLRSGVGSANEVGASFAVRPIVSDDAFVIQMPFSKFQGFSGEIDFTDIDGIDLSFFFEDFAELEIAEISTSSGLPGDYNLDGSVNTSDYVVWRDSEGMTSLPNRNPAATGEIGVDDYLFWKSHFGATFPTAFPAASASVVPEPASLGHLLAIIGLPLAVRTRASPGRFKVS